MEKAASILLRRLAPQTRSLVRHVNPKHPSQSVRDRSGETLRRRTMPRRVNARHARR